MINTIIEAISITLNGKFGDGYKVYREAIEQDLEEPCFFISCLNPTNKLFLGKRYFRRNQFCIQYFPDEDIHKEEDHRNEECYAVAEQILMLLEYLDVGGDLVMGTKMRYEVVDGILHFFVNYDLFVYKVAESVPVMEEVSSETSVKG